MMQNSHYYRLNIDTSNALRSNWKSLCEGYTPDIEEGVWKVSPRDLFNQSWIESINSLGLYTWNSMIFYRGANSNFDPGIAHIDVVTNIPFSVCSFAINWCIGGEGSNIVWYNVPYDNEAGIMDSPAGSTHMSWIIDDRLVKVNSCHIGNQATLINTSIPHSIEMKGDPRWCFSVRTHLSNKLVWTEVVELMRSKNLLIEPQHIKP
jgi:hypothetical protein